MPQLSSGRSGVDVRLLTVSILTLALVTGATASPAATQQELSRARAERQELQQELDRTVAAYNAAQLKLARTQDSIERSQEALAEAETTARLVEQRVSKRADELYRRGPVAIFQYLLNASSFADFGRRLTLIEAASNEDALVLAHANKSRSDIARLSEELKQQEGEERKLLEQMTAQTSALSARFGQAQSLESRLTADREAAARRESERRAAETARVKAEEEARRNAEAAEEDSRRRAEQDARASATPSPTGSPRPTPSPGARPSPSASPRSSPQPLGLRSLRCPVDGVTSFTDTWGHPRSGGRSHQGVDMFAASGTPVVAPVDGSVLRKSSSPAGGISLYYAGNDGYEYFYAHLSGYAEISPGQKMAAGDRLGFVGDTGNAAGGPPHLHFEARPNGGAPINPTALVQRACA